MAKYTLTPAVKTRLLGTTLGTNLDEILDKAAIISHPRGNRRYHNWIFQVDGTVVKAASKMVPQVPVDDGRTFVVYEECSCVLAYEADPTCPKCGGVGEVKVTRKLPFDKVGAAR